MKKIGFASTLALGLWLLSPLLTVLSAQKSPADPLNAESEADWATSSIRVQSWPPTRRTHNQAGHCARL
jgi:hypothetical protein